MVVDIYLYQKRKFYLRKVKYIEEKRFSIFKLGAWHRRKMKTVFEKRITFLKASLIFELF